MSLVIYRVLFFCLVPIGIFILIKTIKMLKGVFNGDIIAEIPFTQKEVTFDIDGSKVYAIWQKGQLFKRTPLDKYQLELTEISSGQKISLSRSIFSPQLNNMGTGRTELRRFSADTGTYRLNIIAGSSVTLLEKLVIGAIPVRPVDQGQYFIQVRESRPVYYMIVAIPLFIVCGFCIIGGFVAGFLAPDILADMGVKVAVLTKFYQSLNC